MSVKQLKDEMLLAKYVMELKTQEFLVAEAKYNLKIAEMELGRKISDLEREQNGN
jgi:hypothetical protein